MSKKYFVMIIIAIVVTIIIIFATVFSIYKFGVINPFSSCFGMFQILFTNQQYVVVQNHPHKVVFSKSPNAKMLLDEYMQNRGFEILPEEQMGSMLVYTNNDSKEYILFTINKYYSKWSWETP